MREIKIKKQRKERRLRRIRNRMLIAKRGIRLSVFRSNKYLYAQIIDDVKGTTLVSVNEKEIDTKNANTKTDKAILLAKLLAQKAKDKKIIKVVFDKGSYRYHGRIKAFADEARAAGLTF